MPMKKSHEIVFKVYLLFVFQYLQFEICRTFCRLFVFNISQTLYYNFLSVSCQQQ